MKFFDKNVKKTHDDKKLEMWLTLSQDLIIFYETTEKNDHLLFDLQKKLVLCLI